MPTPWRSSSLALHTSSVLDPPVRKPPSSFTKSSTSKTEVPRGKTFGKAMEATTSADLKEDTKRGEEALAPKTPTTAKKSLKYAETLDAYK